MSVCRPAGKFVYCVTSALAARARSDFTDPPAVEVFEAVLRVYEAQAGTNHRDAAVVLTAVTQHLTQSGERRYRR